VLFHDDRRPARRVHRRGIPLGARGPAGRPARPGRRPLLGPLHRRAGDRQST
jgi:hypothetical protein